MFLVLSMFLEWAENMSFVSFKYSAYLSRLFSFHVSPR